MDFLSELSMSGTQSWTFALIAGAAIATLAWAAMAASSTLLNPFRRRLAALRDAAGSAAVSGLVRGPASLWSWFEPRDEARRAKLRLQIMQAGFKSRAAGGVLHAAKLVLALALPAAVVILLLPVMHARVPLPLVVVFALIAAFIGSLLPDAYLQRRIEWRRVALMEGFPDALDLLVACTEAGLSFNAALDRVVEQMPASQPALAQELARVNAEIRAGVDRTAALRNLSERTGLDEIRGLVSLITHSTRLGTGIAATLRIYAEEFRDRRTQRAEEIAATVGTQLIFPLVLCLFPSFFVVAIGPAVVSVIRVLSNNPLPG